MSLPFASRLLYAFPRPDLTVLSLVTLPHFYLLESLSLKRASDSENLFFETAEVSEFKYPLHQTYYGQTCTSYILVVLNFCLKKRLKSCQVLYSLKDYNTSEHIYTYIYNTHTYIILRLTVGEQLRYLLISSYSLL